MNKILNTVILFFLGQSIIAQKGIGNLIKAEKDFAAYSVAHSTKEAFLQVIDSNSIMFDNGIPVMAIDFWNKREKRPGILNWHPQFAEISASGDFGYTTGPWTFQNSLQDSIVARGQYSTVWHLDKDGKWKFLADFGIDNTQPGSNEENIIDTPKEPEDSNIIPHIAFLVSADEDFNTLFKNDQSRSYKTYMPSKSILIRNGFLPAANDADRKLLIDSTPAGISCRMNGWGISPARDMGYTYGSAIVKGKTENYLRIWRHEKDGWKIAVEVLRY